MDRPLCIVCKVNVTKKRVAAKGGFRYDSKCDKCGRDPDLRNARIRRNRQNKKPWAKYKKDTCERCGFIPELSCQLGVDHIDGNKENNDPSNYKTLCHNCHSLKSYLSGDHANKRHKKS